MPNKILVLAPHGDDEVLGCGGAICRHKEKGEEVYVAFLRKPYDERSEFQITCTEKSCNILGAEPITCNFDDSVMFNKTVYIREIEKLITLIKPSAIYTTFYGDLHQDHRETFHALNSASRIYAEYRVNKIFVCETISSTDQGILQHIHPFIPNFFVPLKTVHIEKKIEAMKCYSQEIKANTHPRSIQHIYQWAEMRGRLINESFAEAFMAIRYIDD
jgi:LmbE family N-acetylglucosaminyl deacetylase